jgi:hypothetical protein
MRVYQIVLVALLVGTGVPIALHDQAHGGFDLDQMGLAFFLWLNAIIALWEIALFFRIDLIEAQYARFRVEYKGRELDRVKDFFGTKVPAGKIFSPTTWAEVWSSYALFDESYANRRSFGFFIDVGNGFSTLVPTLLCLYGMTYPILPARVLGIVLLILNYQMWYGTLVYFSSYVFNRRYAGHSPGNVALFVGLSNGLWFTFPLWAMYAAIVLIYTDSYAVFHP